MRRFLVTSDKFTGTAEVWYGFDGLLCHVTLIDSVMSFTQIKYLLQNLSPDVLQFAVMLATSGLKIQEQPFDLKLDDFKREYPYSRNYHLLDAMWHKYTLKEQVKIYFAAIQYRKYCERNKDWYKQPKIAATWLAKKEYLNDWRVM